eukprot:s1036_g6.t1
MGSFTHKKLHDMPRDAMMLLLLAALLFVFSFAELRFWNRSTFTGLESSNPVHRPADRASTRHLQDCEVIGWAELCERKKLTAGSCFQLEPTAAAPLCELQGPHGAPAQLLPAATGILTLTSGELRITGIQLRTVNFADAHVEALHEVPSDPNSTESGGAFFSEGSFSLTRSRLTVRGSAAADGGGFAAGGDLTLGGIAGRSWSTLAFFCPKRSGASIAILLSARVFLLGGPDAIGDELCALAKDRIYGRRTWPQADAGAREAEKVSYGLARSCSSPRMSTALSRACQISSWPALDWNFLQDVYSLQGHVKRANFAPSDFGAAGLWMDGPAASHTFSGKSFKKIQAQVHQGLIIECHLLVWRIMQAISTCTGQ